MHGFFAAERYGSAWFAAVLLIIFLAQGIWLVRADLRTSESPGEMEQFRVARGWSQFRRGAVTGPSFAPATSLPSEIPAEKSNFEILHSPLLSLVSAAPLLIVPRNLLDAGSSSYFRWAIRVPFLLCGMLLGASLWYVARRLCGNAGGLIALTLYCFSPAMLQSSAQWHTGPHILAAWGAFGTIFTAIAVAHTLYAPREVVLWNWDRIFLLGIALAIAVGSQFSMIVLAPAALAFMVYVAPVRRRAAVVIWAAAAVVGAVLLFATYFFQAHAFAEAMRHASFSGAVLRALRNAGIYGQVFLEILRGTPILIVLLPIAIGVYLGWPRTRYFGNTAPALVALLMILMAVTHPDGAPVFALAAVPFLFVFVSGVIADLLETSQPELAAAGVITLLAVYVLWNVTSLLRVPT